MGGVWQTCVLYVSVAQIMGSAIRCINRYHLSEMLHKIYGYQYQIFVIQYRLLLIFHVGAALLSLCMQGRRGLCNAEWPACFLDSYGKGSPSFRGASCETVAAAIRRQPIMIASFIRHGFYDT